MLLHGVFEHISGRFSIAQLLLEVIVVQLFFIIEGVLLLDVGVPHAPLHAAVVSGVCLGHLSSICGESSD